MLIHMAMTQLLASTALQEHSRAPSPGTRPLRPRTRSKKAATAALAPGSEPGYVKAMISGARPGEPAPKRRGGGGNSAWTATRVRGAPPSASATSRSLPASKQ